MIQTIDNVLVFGPDPDENTRLQMRNCMREAEAGVLCADNHLGYAVPIGGVLAYRDKISPSGVGFDIGCGNLAVRTDFPYSELKARIGQIMDDIFANISFGVGRNNPTPVDHPLFESQAWKVHPAKGLKQLAENQLGTVGSGNHYVDLLVDEGDSVWIGVHFGSRGLGHKIATHFLKAGGAKDGMMVDPLVVPVDSALGSDYLACMELAGQYAYAGREWVCAEVARMLGANILESVHNHHNYAWKEGEYWVVRKGSTPAFPGQRGFVGGSMGDDSFILEGVEGALSRGALYSTIHGAGRVMSRTAARGKVNRKTGEVISKGLVDPAEMMEWLDVNGVTLRGGGLDEAPQAYKRIREVIGHHAQTIKILHTLSPVGVAMAGNEVFDPYKD